MRTSIDRVITLNPGCSIEHINAHLAFSLSALYLMDLTVPLWESYGPMLYGVTFTKTKGWTVWDERRLDGSIARSGLAKSIFDPRADLGWVDCRVAAGETTREDRLS